MNPANFPRSTVVGKWSRGLPLAAALWCLGFCHAAMAQQATAHDYEGTYGGLYRANQGITRVVLVIEALNDSEVGARYVFFPDNSTPQRPYGEYLLQGTVDSKTGKLVLVGKEWVEHPPNYAMLDVAATLSSDRLTLSEWSTCTRTKGPSSISRPRAGAGRNKFV